MSIASEISRIVQAKEDIREAISGKGVYISSSELIDEYPEHIRQITQTGSDINFEIYDTNKATISDLAGDCVWEYGGEVYYSGGTGKQYVFNSITSTWAMTSWTGYAALIGRNIWKHNGEMYYSNGGVQYKFDEENWTWVKHTWVGLTSFEGYKMWYDGDTWYYSNGTKQFMLDNDTLEWSAITWDFGSDPSVDIDGSMIWSDGTTIYYSNTAAQYVYDKTYKAWSKFTGWSGLTSFYGNSVWNDGENIYYSKKNNSKHFQLDVTTHAWTQITWSGVVALDGIYVYSMNGNTYFNDHALNYKLSGDTSTHTWIEDEFNLELAIYGNQIWTDGTYIYHTLDNINHVYDTTTGMWNAVSFTVMNNFKGEYVWKYNGEIYYSYSTNQYHLVKNDDGTYSRTWEKKTWDGLSSMTATYLYNIDGIVYFSNGANAHYKLNSTTLAWESCTWNGSNVYNGTQVAKIGNDVYWINNGSGLIDAPQTKVYKLDRATRTWDLVTLQTSAIGTPIWWNNGSLFKWNGSYRVIANGGHFRLLLPSMECIPTAAVNNGCNITPKYFWTDDMSKNVSCAGKPSTFGEDRDIDYSSTNLYYNYSIYSYKLNNED